MTEPFPPLSHFPELRIDLRFPSSHGSGSESGTIHTHIDSSIGGFAAQQALLATMFVYDPVCTVLLLRPATFEYEPFPQSSFTLHYLSVFQALLRTRLALFCVGISRVVLVFIG
jgi:hypothetical protein